MASLGSVMKYKGDKGKFRKALKAAGFNCDDRCMFNDRRKDGTRRLKLWSADRVNDAPMWRQHLLHAYLLKEFGRRYVNGYFVKGAYWTRDWASLCIVLRD